MKTDRHHHTSIQAQATMVTSVQWRSHQHHKGKRSGQVRDSKAPWEPAWHHPKILTDSGGGGINRCKSTGTGVSTQQSQIPEFDRRCYWIRNLGLGCYSVVESSITCPRPQAPSPAMQKPNRRQKASASLTSMADILFPMIAFSGQTFDPTTKMSHSSGCSQNGWTLCQHLVFYPEIKHKFQEKLSDESWGSKVTL